MPLHVTRVRRARAAARRAAVVTAVVGAATLAGAPAALAGTSGDDVVRRYEAAVDLSADGVAHVALDLEVDFGSEPNRGPYLTYLVKQRFDDTRDRVYRLRDVTASSPTAPDEVHVSQDAGWLEIRIGEEDRDDVVGVHRYRVTYAVEGLVNTADAFDLADDQLYLNVIGDRWEIPLRDLTVTVTGPADVTSARCYTGTDGVCAAADVRGGAAVFTHDALEPGEPWTVAAAFPAGTFAGVEPILQDRWAVGRAFSLTPMTGGLAALVTVVGLGAVGGYLRRSGRDQAYDGVVPGLVPVPGQDVTASARGRRRDPVAVRFTPPEGLSPGLVGTLVDERAEPRDVTATLVDLAVRGYLTVGPATDEDGDAPGAVGDTDDGTGTPAGEAADDPADAEDWTLTRTAHDTEGAELLPFERTLLDGVFASGDRVRLSALGETFTSTMAAVQAELYEDVTARGWFRTHPARTRTRWAGWGVALLLVGVAVTAALALLTSWALLGLPLVVVGLAMLVTTGAVPARTAQGSAVQAQAEGFRHYLATAEADQLRLEEESDLFSRYLPYAISFGLADRWARVVADAAAAGRPVAEPTWYLGPTAFWAVTDPGRALTGFTNAAESAAVSTTTSGTSGGSGFSVGTAGGGVSGGGGGTW